MAQGRHTETTLTSRVALGLVRACAVATALGCANAQAAPGPEWISLGVLGGTSAPDSRFADYQWDVSARTGLGAQALAGFGRTAAGLRVWSAETRQSLNLPGAQSPDVRWTSLESVSQTRLFEALGHDLMATASAGAVWIGYTPDRVSFDPGSGSQVEVTFAPVVEWIAGAGVAVRRPIAEGWTIALDLERRFFALDTAHRNGSTIETRRETFGDWNARLEVAWRHRLR